MASSTFKYDLREFVKDGQPPVAFVPALMPEWRHQENMSFGDGMAEIQNYYEKVWSFLNGERARYEPRWKLCREYYSMDATGKIDSARLASIFAQYTNQGDAELNPERAAMVYPLIFEAVQEQQARLGSMVFGTGPSSRYVEVLGRDENDVEGARAYEELASYQQEWQIPTQDISDDVVNRGLVEGTGLTVSIWDFETNCPQDSVPDLMDYWFDPQGEHYQKDRWNIWRRYPTLGELLFQREIGYLLFSDEDMKNAITGAEGTTSNTTGRKRFYRGPKIRTRKDFSKEPLEQQVNRHHEVVPLDILMQRTGVERWVYVCNKLVVAVRENPIPKENIDEDIELFKYPVSMFTPIRKTGEKYGDSAVYRMLDSQDMVNSISYLMMSNFAVSAQGMFFGDPNMYSGDSSPKPGVINNMEDPQNSLLKIDMPDVLGPSAAAIQFIRASVTDLISGVKDYSRGQQASANQTAWSVDTLQQQTQFRIKSMANRGRNFRRNYDALHLLLNQRYLAPTTVVRITSNDGTWRPIEGADLFGVAGKDLMPTGLPVAGSETMLMQQGMNLVPIIAQTGGDVKPLMRRMLEAQFGGSLNIDEIYPEIPEIGKCPIQENEFMANGATLNINPGDDDKRHIDEHWYFSILMEMQNQPMNIIQAIGTHLAMHQSRYYQMQAESGQVGDGEQGSGPSGLNTQIPQPDPKNILEIGEQVQGSQSSA